MYRDPLIILVPIFINFYTLEQGDFVYER